MFNHREVRQSGRIMHFFHLALLGVTHIADVGHGGDHIHVELTVETLLDDFHVEQTQKTTTETEAQRYGTLRRKGQGGIVELKLLQRSTQVLVICRIDGIDTGKHHRLHLLEALNGSCTGVGHMGNRVTYLHLLRVLDTTDDIAHIPRPQFFAWNHVHLQHTDLVGIIFHACVEELHVVTGMNHSVDDFEVGNDASERIEHRVENQGLQWSVLISFRMRNPFYYSIEDLLDALTGLSGSTDDI